MMKFKFKCISILLVLGGVTVALSNYFSKGENAEEQAKASETASVDVKAGSSCFEEDADLDRQNPKAHKAGNEVLNNLKPSLPDQDQNAYRFTLKRRIIGHTELLVDE